MRLGSAGMFGRSENTVVMYSCAEGVRNESLPSFRDAAIASEYAWRFLQDARTHDMPAIGDLGELEEIRDRRRTMKTATDCSANAPERRRRGGPGNPGTIDTK